MALFSLLLIPSLFWAAYHYYKDRHRPEPLLNLVLAYGLGFAAAYLGLLGYELLGTLGLRYDAFALAERSKAGLLLYAVAAIGSIEELAKFIPFIIVISRLRHFDEPLDGIVYASFIALGFATHENLGYLPYLEGWEAVGRALVSPLVHIMFASIWGYAYASAAIRGTPRTLPTLFALLCAILAHGIYDFIAIGMSQWIHVAPPVIILGIWVWRMHTIRKLHLEYEPVPIEDDESARRR